jgi:phosphate-selective porin OprO and OprP
MARRLQPLGSSAIVTALLALLLLAAPGGHVAGAEPSAALAARLAVVEAQLAEVLSQRAGPSNHFEHADVVVDSDVDEAMPVDAFDSAARSSGWEVVHERSAAPAKPAGPPPPSAEPKKFPTVTVNGVFQADAGFFDQDPSSKQSFGDLQDGADFRRARLSAKGSVTDLMNYFVQMDFAFFGRPTFTDLWLEQTQLPVLGNVRVGQWKQPFSLEVVSSFRYTTFMERSLLFQPFTPFRHLGAGFYNHSDNLRATWAASIFRSGQDQFGGSISDDGGLGLAERFTWLPYYDEASDGRDYLHLGVAHFFSAPPNERFNFRTVPEIYVGENAAGVVGTSEVAAPGAFNGTPFFASTGSLVVDHYHVLGAELLWVRGPLSVQSEAMVALVDRPGGDTAALPGAYTQVGYFLTGEHRPYDRKQGQIDRLNPHADFYRVCTPAGVATGPGAWELAARLSWIDLNDQDIHGGELVDATAGVNWFLNPYCKLVFNYIHAFADDPGVGHSDANIYAMRAQLDF